VKDINQKGELKQKRETRFLSSLVTPREGGDGGTWVLTVSTKEKKVHLGKTVKLRQKTLSHGGRAGSQVSPDFQAFKKRN